MSSSTPRNVQAEIDWQAERAARIADIRPTPDYIFERYRQAKNWKHFAKEYVFHLLKDCQGKTIFDFGCGEGEFATQCAKIGGRLTSMDISPDLIELASRRAALDGVDGNIHFVVADILTAPLPEALFDYVVCNAVLHHVDLYQVVPVLMDYLKPGGTAILVEPVALSPGLQKLRDAVPLAKDASPDERQLNQEDIDFFRKHLPDAKIMYFNLFGRLSRLIPNLNKIDKGHPFAKASAVGLMGFDRFMLNTFSGLRKYSGTIVLSGTKPLQ